MSLLKRLTPITNTHILRYSHHHSLKYYNFHKKSSLTHILKNNPELYYFENNNFVINLLGNQKYVDAASWEIKSFAVEKNLHTSNIVCETGILQRLLLKNNHFIINRCYNINCSNLLYLNHNIFLANRNTKIYNLYILPNATNRFNTNTYIKNYAPLDIIVYPLAASEENKRRDIHILIDN